MSQHPDDEGDPPDPERRSDFATRSERSTRSSRRMHAVQPGVVLLIDDEESVRRSVRRMIEGAGFAVIEAEDGEAALTRLREGLRPVAILLDLSMPRLNGYQFRVRQLAEPTLAKIPVIIVSGEADHPDTSRLQASGYVSKPFSRNILLAALQAATHIETA